MLIRVLPLLALACRPDPTLPGYSGAPLWDAPDLALAVDLGHVPAQVPLAGGPLTFERAVGIGLDAVVGGGNTHGVALGVLDLDGDGAPEILVANGRSNNDGTLHASTLWHNRGDGTFEDATASSGLAAILDGSDLYSVAAGDFDDDGDPDLYLARQPTNVLLENLGGLVFAEVTDARGAAATPSDPAAVRDGRSKLVTMGDFDRDGRLDLVSATSTQPSPGATVLRNAGDAFEDVTDDANIRIDNTGHPCAMMFTDYDNDGWSDLWVWNDRGGHTLLHHTGERWQPLGNGADRTTVGNPMGIDAADIDHDGDLDYYVSNIGTHPLLVNDGNGRFEQQSESWGTVGDFGWGLGFEDFDRDGWADLFVTQEDERPWLAYRNTGEASFERSEWGHAAILSGGAAHNVPAAFADLDGDGRIDVVGANTDGAALTVLMNRTEPAGHWLDVVVRAAPETGQYGGVGARVAVVTGDLVQFRDITGGASRASQSELSARFGLGDWDGADQVVVLWPDGRQIVRTGVPGDRRLVLPE
ncbi:MAG: CRTAC1 family protein [Alphaproteobacteria bacterium]|nr:CRTAC1 family protein [Alphaproteobacteria bacterium]